MCTHFAAGALGFAGFAIMYGKLEEISKQVVEMVELYKESQGIQVNFELRKILSEHSDMLDCRKKQKPYTEEKMRKLVDGEYNVLELLIETFLADISSDREELLHSILSLASMLSASVKFFDEIYYFENKEALDNGEQWYISREKWWHISHNKWISVFDRLSSEEFIKKVQDFGFFEKRLNTVENDYLYIGVYDQVRSLKQDIEDNQNLIIVLDDRELFRRCLAMVKENVQIEIENAHKEFEVSVNNNAMLVALAS